MTNGTREAINTWAARAKSNMAVTFRHENVSSDTGFNLKSYAMEIAHVPQPHLITEGAKPTPVAWVSDEGTTRTTARHRSFAIQALLKAGFLIVQSGRCPDDEDRKAWYALAIPAWKRHEEMVEKERRARMPKPAGAKVMKRRGKK